MVFEDFHNQIKYMNKFYYSVMNAGKTTQLLQANNIYTRKGYNTLIIKPSVDDREGECNGWGTIESRLIKEDEPCLYVDKINKTNNTR